MKLKKLVEKVDELSGARVIVLGKLCSDASKHDTEQHRENDPVRNRTPDFGSELSALTKKLRTPER